MLAPVSPPLEGNQGIVLNLNNLSLEKLNLFGLSKKRGGLGPGGGEERENNFFFLTKSWVFNQKGGFSSANLSWS